MRRARVFIAIAGVLALVLLLVHGLGGGGTKDAKPGSTLRLTAHTAPPLTAPISGEAVVATRTGPLILGGLDSTSASVSGVFQMQSGSGSLHAAGALATPLHDAAAAVLGDQVLVFGGGQTTSTDSVQSLPAPNGAVTSNAIAHQIGHLPTVRSDLSAVTIGGRAFVLGGYDGSKAIDSVLATRDGRSFTQVAKLPAPARYMAVAPAGGKIYAFGGETPGGGASDAIQEVDPGSGAARVVGHLPQALSHASAVVLAGHIFILGGETGNSPSAAIWRFDPGTGKVTGAGRLPAAMAGGAATTVGSTGYLIGGTGPGGAPLRTVVSLSVQRRPVSTGATAASAHPRTAARGISPFNGRLLIADRGNNRLLLVNTAKKVLWTFPSRAHPAPPGGFYFPDDAFFTHHGTQLISNEEQNERVVQLAFPSGKLLWSYGHPGVSGSQPGYLHEPDDAYLLRDGRVTVADAQNCRVLILSPGKKILRQFGTPAACGHNPPHELGSPNGDTPLPDGNLLISEINGSYIDEITPSGKVVWSIQLPITYPSDPQQLGPDLYLVADYARPGGIYEFNRAGKILWSYHPASGRGMLDHPSLAELLPNGLIATNDDYRDRVVIIDPRSKRIVWQYGRTDNPGRGPDRLHIPDGFDLLSPGGATPTHPSTG